MTRHPLAAPVALFLLGPTLAADVEQRPFAYLVRDDGKTINRSLAVTADGKLLAVGGCKVPFAGGEPGAVVWSLETGKEAFRLTFAECTIWVAAFSSDGKLLAVGGDNGDLRLFDVAGRKEVGRFAGHLGVIHEVAFAAGDSRVVECADDCQVRVWDVKNHAPVAAFRFESDGSGLSGKALWKTVEDRDKPKLVVRPDIKIDRTYKIAVSPDGKHVAVALGKPTVMIFDLATGEVVKSIDANADDEICSVAYSHDGKLLALGGGTKPGSVEVRRIEDNKQLFRADRHKRTVLHLAFSPDDKHLLSGGVADGLKVWDLEAKKPVRHEWSNSLPALGAGSDERVCGLGFLPGGSV